MNVDIKSGFKFQSQYIKNLSFESPKVPQKLPHTIVKPNIDVGVNVNAITINNESNIFEVEINTKAEASQENELVFTTELTYAGVVQLNGIDEKDKSVVILVEIPSILFPFVRRIIADTVRDGGFPPLYIEPIDFLKLYQNNIKQN
tara:strand:- start:27402 stop:27839 length:438 start_codon:yes stop_codon:yes gene_type:complete